MPGKEKIITSSLLRIFNSLIAGAVYFFALGAQSNGIASLDAPFALVWRLGFLLFNLMITSDL
jgi:hypothetical protein